jgi:glutaminyl-peptide cyclotransferase
MVFLQVVLLYSILALVTLAYVPLSEKTLKTLPGPGSDFDIRSGALLAPLLRTRVPGTDGSVAVQEHFVNFFRTNLPKWRIDFQNSTSTTPLSNGEQVPFKNIIITRDPPWATDGEVGRLALVAHYDSKIHPTGFIGATDSAAPCAMLLHTARSIDEALTKKWEHMQSTGEHLDDLEGHKGIQILLLDGEEAFQSWTDTDSLYGARSLAESWENTYHSAASTYHNPLASIHLFLLLDLLGSKDPQIPSYFKTTHWAYKSMSDLEGRLRQNQQFKSSPNHPKKRSSAERSLAPERRFLYDYNKDNDIFMSMMVSDDHLPFMARGVEVLHIIPTPFPAVWHQITDDGEHLDIDTVEDWALLVTAFAGEWLDLEGFFPLPGKRRSSREGNENEAGRLGDKTEL